MSAYLAENLDGPEGALARASRRAVLNTPLELFVPLCLQAHMEFFLIHLFRL